MKLAWCALEGKAVMQPADGCWQSCTGRKPEKNCPPILLF